jgi:hypothetical protein
MHYILKHNDIDVAEIAINSDFRVDALKVVPNRAHLPLEIAIKNNLTNFDFDDWLGNRAVSEQRMGMSRVLRKLNVSSTREILVNNYGLGLIDHYWICPKGRDLKWKDVNFFENDFKEDMGDFLIGDFSKNRYSQISPEGASAGQLPKKWYIENGKRFLLKAGSPPYFQEPFNEVIASRIMDLLSINHTEYKLKQINNNWYCCCENYLGIDNENVIALFIDKIKSYGQENRYDHYLNICNSLGVKDIVKKIDQMIVVDYLIGNTDRHYGNFGLLRNSGSLEYIDVLPIYDCGTSIWNMLEIDKIRPGDDIPNESFRNTHNANIELVKNFEWLDFMKLKNIDRVAEKVFEECSSFDSKRKELICMALKKRAGKLAEMEG